MSYSQFIKQCDIQKTASVKPNDYGYLNEVTDRINAERADLALLVMRLVRRMKTARKGEGHASDDAALANSALEYLRSKGLTTPLR